MDSLKVQTFAPSGLVQTSAVWVKPATANVGSNVSSSVATSTRIQELPGMVAAPVRSMLNMPLRELRFLFFCWKSRWRWWRAPGCRS